MGRKKERAEKMDYDIAHQSGKIVGVFEPEKWLYADDKEFSTSQLTQKGLVLLVRLQLKFLEYLNKDIPSEF